ncbi:MAG: ubiquitin-like small modifier protein 1 [Dehalococcoidia bacterium]|nr:ubiquitin-like small modifier protein 1 [Dehalococcoidia bacterium]
MAVEVRVPAVLRQLVGDARTVRVEGSTVKSVLDNLDKGYPGFKQRIMTDGHLHEFVNIYLNNEDVRFLKELETPVADGDVVSILPAIAGG